MINRDNDRAQVAWDIETTGFGWADEITVTGFWFPDGHATLLLNTDSQPVDTDEFEARLTAPDAGLSVNLESYRNEAALLDALQDVIFEQFDASYDRLIAFNADSWKGGFDLPFLRTRCVRHDQPWVFDGLQFADLYQPVEKRLNTTAATHDSSVEVNSLPGSHTILFGDADTSNVFVELPDDYPPYQQHDYDPFTDSSSAVYCYQANEFLPVLQHNLADIHRTWELGELVRQYVPSKDITDKKL